MHLLSYGPGDIHRDGLEQAGEPSAHSAGKRRSGGTRTGERAECVRGAHRERGRVGKCLKDKVLLEVGLRTLAAHADRDGEVLEGGAARRELVKCGSVWSSPTTRKPTLSFARLSYCRLSG